jgi:hypothetical protein
MPKKGRKPSRKTAAKSGVAARTRKLTKKQQKAKTKKYAATRKPLPGSFRLTLDVFKTLKKFWKPLAGIVLIYSLLNLLFASGFIRNIGSTVSEFKDDLQPVGDEQVSELSNALNGFGTLITGGSGSTGSTMQAVLLILESLVIIWALRQLLAGETIRVKQAYYQSMAPLIPFLLVILVIVIQLLPLTLGTAIMAVVLSSAITNAALVNFIFGLIFVLLAAWTIYMVSSSIFSLYIVTLPDMQPRDALRSAKNLVRFRRWPLIRRLLFLPFFSLLVIGLIVVPLIAFADFLVTPVFFILVMLAILFAHTYLYTLYRKMIA